jgi:hypothetical protein
MVRRILALALAACLVTATARRSDAFCGFYVAGAGAKLFNDATMVVLLRDGTRTVLSMQNAYKGPPEKFAMIVPVPVVLSEDNVKTLPRQVFDHIDQLASPRLVEYWEQDPCAPVMDHRRFMSPARAGAAGGLQALKGEAAEYGVTIEAQFTVGEYEIVILSAVDSSGLEAWLHKENYSIPDGAEPYLRPYVVSGSKFFVARVDISKVQMEGDHALLSPLRFHYDTDDFRLPVRLGLINSSGTQDLIVHILGRSRYEVANYPNVTIPTNLDVADPTADQFAAFYTTLFDRTAAKNPKAVVTEYAWEPTSCDPCPGPPLDMGELATFGFDVAPSAPPPSQRPQGPRPGRPMMRTGTWVLTRLHARYTKDSLGEDLVFREAAPVIGGREVRGPDDKLENGAQPSPFNNFQARYAIRHPWTGPIECKEPRRGIWGGRPDAPTSSPAAKAAQRLGLVTHAKMQLASFVKQDVPEIGFVAASEIAGAGSAAAGRKTGCLGCAVAGSADSLAVWAGSGALLGVAAGLVRRRLRKKTQ